MSHHPGFRYDSARKRAHFDCYVPGTSGEKRRRRTVSAPNRAQALALWRAFQDELVSEATGDAPDQSPPESAPVAAAHEVASSDGRTLSSFLEDHFATIAAGLRPSTVKSHTSIIKNRLVAYLRSASSRHGSTGSLISSPPGSRAPSGTRPSVSSTCGNCGHGKRGGRGVSTRLRGRGFPPEAGIRRLGPRLRPALSAASV